METESPRQFVVVSFKPDDKRTYTYHWDGEPFAIGDDAKAPDNRSDGWKRVKVVDVHDVKPPYPTKALVGKFAGAPIDAIPMPEPDPSRPSGLWADGDRDQ